MKKLILAFALLAAHVTVAAEPVVCSISVNTSTATSTSGTCSWPAGSTVMLQCDVDVFIDSTKGATATSADQRINFTSNNDPYLVYLDAGDQHISILSIGSSGTCKFMRTLRRKPY